VYRQGLMAAQARGDYRGRGGYARGDPGIFGSLFHGITGAIGGFLTGGPMGAVRGAISGVLRTAQAPIGATLPPPVTFPMALAPRPQRGNLPQGRAGPVVVVPRGGAWEPTEVMTPGHGLPRRRRMNIGNAKALRRAIRRARGFEKLARKVMGFTSPRKPKGRSYFRASRKKA